MKISAEQLAQRLRASLGSDAITNEASVLGDHKVDGLAPSLICTPASAEQIVAAVKICAEAQAAITPWGGGTAMKLGNPPRALEVVVKTSGLNRVIEHDAANLTATVQSGMSLAALQATLAPQKQFAPLDAPAPERSTIGGIVAANLNGPSRASYGSVRDLVIGMKVVLASGETIKAGGKVVKNVAGYDMCKLFTGSLGTLGIITEITLRMAPLPVSTATVIAAGRSAELTVLAKQLAQTKLLPSATFLLQAGASAPWQLAVSFDGFAETVARQVNQLAAMMQPLGLSQEIIDGESEQQRWRGIGDLPLAPHRVVYRVTMPRSAVTETLATLAGWSANLSFAADLAMGTTWLSQAADPRAENLLPRLAELAQKQRGHAILFAAPPWLKQGIDIWGPVTPAHGLMAKIKQEFDPNGLFNPGRFIGGL